MVTEPTHYQPKKYLIEVDYLVGWELLNSVLDRRAKLDGYGEPTLSLLSARAEHVLREALDLPAPDDEPWGGLLQYQAEDR